MENTLHIVATHLQSSQFVTFLHCCIVFTVESFHLRKKSSDQNVSENFPVSSTSTTMTIDHQHQPPCRKLKRFSALGAKSKPKNSQSSPESAGWFNLYWFNLGWFDLGWFDLGWFYLDWFNLDWFDLGWFYLDWFNLGWFYLYWFNLGKALFSV